MVNSNSHEGIQYPIRKEDCSVNKIENHGRAISIHWASGHISRYNRFWLRDNCSSGGDKLSAIRSFYLRQMDEQTEIENAEIFEDNQLKVSWKSEDHTSFFKLDWLREHCPEKESRKIRKHRPVSWGDEINDDIPTINFSSLETGNSEHLKLLTQIVDYGLSHVTDLPSTSDGIETLEKYLAPYTSNDFGRIFDLISEPDVWDLSQSSEALDPHSDDPYRYSPPGVRILFCVEASGGGGGASSLTNGIAACEEMRSVDIEGFKLLSEISIPYIRYREDIVPQGADVHLRSRAPIIRINENKEIEGIRFHERSMGTFDLPPEVVDDYYLALIKFSKIITSGRYSLNHLLQPGEAFVFDNQQVLHGRTAFTGKPGRRHLRLCQMDRDLIHSHYRLLLSQHGKIGAADVLAAGV